jgi:hypothetical protein
VNSIKNTIFGGKYMICNYKECAFYNPIFDNNCAQFEIQDSKKCRYYENFEKEEKSRVQKFWDFLKGREMK